MLRETKAFTLMEVIVVIVAIGLLAAFSVPNYIKAIQKADERNMIMNLKIIRTAAEIYVESGDSVIPAPLTLQKINEALRISIVDPKSLYECPAIAPTMIGCFARHPSGWIIDTDTSFLDGKVRCIFGVPCPSCPVWPGDCE